MISYQEHNWTVQMGYKERCRLLQLILTFQETILYFENAFIGKEHLQWSPVA